uniref:Uncharacterized protein n=1 Tax=Pseudoalteromonas undina TaxID=43660 RepID=A0ABN0NMV1_9GAMM
MVLVGGIGLAAGFSAMKKPPEEKPPKTCVLWLQHNQFTLMQLPSM